MAFGCQIPLERGREAGIPQPEIAELYPVAVVEQLSTANLVPERPEPATKIEQHDGEQIVILQGRHPGLPWRELAGVVILQQLRQDAADVSVTDVAGHLRGQPGAIDIAVQIPEKAQRRKRIQAPPPWRRQDDRADIEDRHASPRAVNHLNLHGLPVAGVVHLELMSRQPGDLGSWDVVVVGSGSAGSTAAISAARAGAVGSGRGWGPCAGAARQGSGPPRSSEGSPTRSWLG